MKATKTSVSSLCDLPDLVIDAVVEALDAGDAFRLGAAARELAPTAHAHCAHRLAGAEGDVRAAIEPLVLALRRAIYAEARHQVLEHYEADGAVSTTSDVVHERLLLEFSFSYPLSEPGAYPLVTRLRWEAYYLPLGAASPTDHVPLGHVDLTIAGVPGGEVRYTAVDFAPEGPGCADSRRLAVLLRLALREAVARYNSCPVTFVESHVPSLEF